MPSVQTQAYLRNYIQTNVENGVWKFSLRIATNCLDWIITLATGYEVSKVTSDEKKDIWTFVEFFIVSTLCVFVWIVKCCCLNRFCITCCIKCCMKCAQRNQPEEIPMRNRDTDEAEAEASEDVGTMKSILNKLHMILNRLAIGAIGFELRKQLFNFKPLTTWDYIEISAIVLFCIWILSIKYCILKCHCLKCCYCCVRFVCCKKHQGTGTTIDQNEIKNVENVEARD